MESRTIAVDPKAPRHRLIAATSKVLNRGKPDTRGILFRKWDQPECLDIRVTRPSLERALSLANTIVSGLEREKFAVTIGKGEPVTHAMIFGHSIPFTITEKVHQVGRREVTEYSCTRTVFDYEGTGILEFRAGDGYCCLRIRDNKRQSLEMLIPKCLGALMREARSEVLRAEQARLDEIERRRKAQERAELAELIAQEEKKVKDFEGWVDSWARARQLREFIAVLETIWKEQNVELSPESSEGQRIIWMRQQADRTDPLVTSPSSILDRKNELSHYW
jgi:hypothetical protein